MKLVVGQGSCGIAAGASKVYDALASEIAGNDNMTMGITGCIGMCYLEPIVDVYNNDNALLVRLVKVKPEDAHNIVSSLETMQLEDLEPLMISDSDKGFLKKQTRIVLRHCGIIDPTSIDEYKATDGFLALDKAVNHMTCDEVIEEIKVSGLGGRGGAGLGAISRSGIADSSTAAVISTTSLLPIPSTPPSLYFLL